MMSSTDQLVCECDVSEPGRAFCERHGVEKNQALRKLCQAGQRGEPVGLQYWQSWERGVGPKQAKPQPEIDEPGMIRKAANYTKAVAVHVASGCKKRSQEEIDRIYTTICQPCEFYDSERGGCTKCGCRVGRRRSALRNKVAMASQHCPKGKW